MESLEVKKTKFLVSKEIVSSKAKYKILQKDWEYNLKKV